jgi:hypothetical protein
MHVSISKSFVCKKETIFLYIQLTAVLKHKFFNCLYYKLPYFKVRRLAVFVYNWLSKNTLTQLYFCVTFITTCFDLKVPSLV